MKTMLLFVVGIFLSLSAIAQPLQVDANTLALWNFEIDQPTVVLDRSPNNIHGTANFVALVDSSPLNLGKARFFLDQTSFLSFPPPQYQSALDLGSKDNWTIEFRLLLAGALTSTRNIYSYGGVVIEVQDGRVSAVVNSHGISYGVKTEQTIAGSARIAVVSTPSEIGILVNGRVAASQSKDPAKGLKIEKTMQSPLYIGGTPQDTLQTASVGSEHGCAITGSGSLLCWGNNESAELGNGSYSGQFYIPHPIQKLDSPTHISNGNKFTCGVGNEKLYCWGANTNLALGIQGIADSTLPIFVENVPGITSIDSGAEHSCSLFNDGSVRCWGRNSEGQLGLGVITPSSLISAVPGLLGIKKIATGSNHSCAIDENNDVLCWGSNDHGQLGNTGGNNPVPSQVVGVVGAIQIALGEQHTCALLETSEIKCWGGNLKGQLGNGQTVSSADPVLVSGISPDIPTGVYAGGAHTCATLNSGRVKCWGSNSNLQIGLPLSQQMALAAVDSNLAGVQTMYIGKNTSCYKKYSGLACIGSNLNGLLARGSQFPTNAQTEVPSLLFRPSNIPGFIDDIRVSRVARFSLARPLITANFDTNVSVPNPQIQLNVNSALGLNATSLRVTLNGDSVSGLILNGTSISGVLSNELLPGDNVLEVSIQDTIDNFGKVVIPIKYNSVGTPNSPEAIVTSSLNSCYLDGLGDVYCWGSNKWGQLGIKTSAFSSSPIKNPRLRHIKKIALSDGAICALNIEGDVYCLGSNLGGQLGRNSTTLTSSNYPLEVDIDGDVEDIFASSGSFCAKPEDRGPWKCWGNDTSYSMGLGNFNFAPKDSPDTQDFVTASFGPTHSCYLKNDSTLWCRGSNFYKQLGNHAYPNGSEIPVQVEGSYKKVVAGVNWTCATALSDHIYCWGLNRRAQYGTGTSSPEYPHGAGIPTPSAIAPGKEYELGDGFVCSKNSNDKVVCWGTNEKGEIGRGDLTFDPVGYVQTLDFESFSARGSTVCGITFDKKVYCWGMNSNGQAGTPVSGFVKIPTQVIPHSGVFNSYHSLALGEVNSCFISGDSSYCWGATSDGQLGIGTGTSTEANELYPVNLPSVSNVIQASVGLGHICQLNQQNEVFCAGNNRLLQTGGNSGNNVLRFTKVEELPAVSFIDAGFDFTCAIALDKTVWCWGSNTSGQLGNTVSSPKFIPVKVQELDNVVEIEVSLKGQFACAIKGDKTVWCWGYNGFRQIPDMPPLLAIPKPFEVKQLKDSITLSIGSTFTCGLNAQGKAKCGSSNNYGTSGIGHRSNNASWDDVMIDKLLIDIKAGANHVCALDVSNVVYCWGENDRGQVGAGYTSLSIDRPRKVIENVRELSVGGLHSCVITNDNRLACWGVNTNGQFGNGTTVDSLLPVFSDISKKL